MKKLLALTLILGNQGFAKEEQNTISTEVNISLHSLRCVTQARDIRHQYTILGGEFESLAIIHGQDSSIRLTHRMASNEGCDLEKLGQISEESQSTFGFALAKVEGLRVHSQSRVAGNGKCVADITETLNIDLGKGGVVLTSKEIAIIPMSDCEKVPASFSDMQ